MLYSEEAGSRRESLFISSSITFFASFRIVSFSIRSWNFFVKLSFSSFSMPSSFLIAFSCSFSKCVRCDFSIWSVRFSLIFAATFASSSSLIRRMCARPSLLATSRSSTTSWRASLSEVVRQAVRSANWEAFLKSTLSRKIWSWSLKRGLDLVSSLMMLTISLTYARIVTVSSWPTSFTRSMAISGRSSCGVLRGLFFVASDSPSPSPSVTLAVSVSA
mmetsp:Transcript_2600/g.9228  ORF Transcript_2600/g.9228 Transcript_2600/m.9228 type:complete len:218 (+) Transcript_2600:460-1113(+)